jgi:hypothetical protein
MLENLVPPVRSKGSCKVASEAEKLNDSDKAILLTAVDDRDQWPIKSLARELRALGIQISESPLSSHRSRSCACYR